MILASRRPAPRVKRLDTAVGAWSDADPSSCKALFRSTSVPAKRDAVKFTVK